MRTEGECFLHFSRAQTKDATSALKKNYSSFAAPNYYHSIKVMSSCPHAAAETKCYCVTIEVLILCKLKYINDGTNILDNKTPWRVSNYETGLYGWKYSLSVFFPLSQHISRFTSTYYFLYIYISLKTLNSVNLTPPLFKGCKRHDLRCWRESLNKERKITLSWTQRDWIDYG